VKGKDAVEFMAPGSLKSALRDLPADSITYADLSSFKPAEVQKTLKLLYAAENIRWGVVDPKGAVKDPAEIFHRGGADYVGKDLVTSPLTPARFAAVTNFRLVEAPAAPKVGSLPSYIPSGKDWATIREGREYTFCMMFIELDNQAALRKSASDKHIHEVTRTFHDFVQRTVAAMGGKVWIWMDFGGLVLIPFDGERCEAVLSCLRMMMNRVIISAEECDLGMHLSYRIALHIGNTVYRARGDTGTIISDSINSIFHLGQKFARPGHFLVTENAEPFIPAGVRDLFKNEGVYEGRMIYRLSLPG
jgi:hypothetical protein